MFFSCTEVGKRFEKRSATFGYYLLYIRTVCRTAWSAKAREIGFYSFVYNRMSRNVVLVQLWYVIVFPTTTVQCDRLLFETPEWMKTLIFFKSVIFRPCSVSNRARVFHEPPPSRSKFPRQPRPVRESPSQRKWRLSVVLSYVVERSILLWRLEKKCVPRSIQVFCCPACTKKT